MKNNRSRQNYLIPIVMLANMPDGEQNIFGCANLVSQSKTFCKVNPHQNPSVSADKPKPISQPIKGEEQHCSRHFDGPAWRHFDGGCRSEELIGRTRFGKEGRWGGASLASEG